MTAPRPVNVDPSWLRGRESEILAIVKRRLPVEMTMKDNPL
jgi:hypothetical protein